MKHIIYSILFIASALLISSCEEETTAIFITDISTEDIAFTNSFASEYLLSEDTEDNIADRFIWNETSLGVANNYELQAAIDAAFTTPVSIGTTNGNNLAVLVSQLLDLAEDLGLDNDPATTATNGDPNNTGMVYFRVKSIIGNGGAGTSEIVSEVQSINITWIEETEATTACDSLWLVGDAIVDAGWNFTIASACDAGVHKVKVSLVSGVFRFFEVEGDWDSGLSYAYYEGEGYTIDANFENDGGGDANFKFIGTAGIYEIEVDDNLKTIVLNASGSLWAVGDATPGAWDFAGGETEVVEISPNVWEATFALSSGVFRFFQISGDWGSGLNYTYYEGEGYIIDSNLENDGGDDANFNFVGTPGTYVVTVNAIDKTITLLSL